MRISPSALNLLLATLLVASNVVFAGHTATHAVNKVGNCELCVCQGQTPAAPLPATQRVNAEPQPGAAPQPSLVTLLAEPASHPYQPRAPPFQSS